MSIVSIQAERSDRSVVFLFGAALLASAALVFAAEPMIAKMILPLLGGSPAVWNTSMAFFQTALLAGYLYAHVLQRLRSVRTQVFVHLLLLCTAALILPVHVTNAIGLPSTMAPAWWLFRVLALSIGPPFVMLSATAPLLQAWYARASGDNAERANPYVLYVASNLGSMLALLAYPALIEPLITLHAQTAAWAMAYGAFVVLTALVGMLVMRDGAGAAAATIAIAPSSLREGSLWRERIGWLALAAAPSSLMLGVTTYISDDVASTPLFWVIPLALYLLTFIIAFQTTPLISSDRALRWHALFVAMAAGLLCVNATSLVAHLLAYLGAFFFSALVCHQRLAATRPGAERLTEFYLLLSLGGVLGGAFNAFVAPLIFSRISEFPLVLALCLLARPWSFERNSSRSIFLAGAGVFAALAIPLVPASSSLLFVPAILAILSASFAAAVTARLLPFGLIIGLLCAEASLLPLDGRVDLVEARNFFGVLRVTQSSEAALGGDLHLLFHGTTIHGAQPQVPAQRCRTTTYYARATPIGQTFETVLARRSAARIGVVGLGTGTVAAYTRPGDRLRFFEINPDVVRIARDPRYFSYLSGCTKGTFDVVLGDARLMLARENPGTYDLLMLDAFSADNVPTHLLTVEAFRLYLAALRPNGVVLLHLSNRNLSLEAPAAAAAKEIGAVALMQDFSPPQNSSGMVAAPTKAMLIAKSKTALSAFVHDRRWRDAQDNGVRAWSDDYTNIVGAMIAHAMHN